MLENEERSVLLGRRIPMSRVSWVSNEPMTDPHYINEHHSDLRGVKEGWYAIDERGNLLLGPFSNRENCLTGISQLGTDECRK